MSLYVVQYLFALLSDARVKSAIRTGWPMLLGAVATWLATSPLHLPASMATVAVVWAGGALVYLAGRWLETRTGTGLASRLARGLGAFALSLGLVAGKPVYPTDPPANP